MQKKARTMKIIQRDNFDFAFDPNACNDCPGYCCCGEPGKIWVNAHEINQICAFLQINIIDFTDTYLNRFDNQSSIIERYTENGFECVFFDNVQKHCSIYKVRPSQCRQYPFWKHLKEQKTNVVQECPGII
ncbi:protein belonging to Uncharacterized protein family UPF0153 [Candidatus Magnetomorum sp. HK-1]|nr:protein belonging to Uncharacterized protein family UPF0153 [Candidatus Magnetomorum sp. HK-1]